MRSPPSRRPSRPPPEAARHPSLRPRESARRASCKKDRARRRKSARTAGAFCVTWSRAAGRRVAPRSTGKRAASTIPYLYLFRISAMMLALTIPFLFLIPKRALARTTAAAKQARGAAWLMALRPYHWV